MQNQSDQSKEIRRKVAQRLIPFLGLLYLLAFLDRVNVGFAAITMNADLGFSPAVFGTGAGLFFVGYVLFGVPSNLMLHRFGAHRWIGLTMVFWGLISAAMALIHSVSSFYVLRLLLGIAESGFFPGMILYLTYWFGETDRTRILGAFMVALPLSSAIGAPISASLLELNAFGVHGWRWIFLLEGIPAAAVGLLTLKILADGPQQAEWLTLEERALLVRRTREHREQAEPTGVLLTLKEGRLWVFGAAYLALLLTLYGYSIWLPQIIQGLAHFSDRDIGLLTMTPNLAAAVLMYPWSRHSDATAEKSWHVAAPLFLGALGLVITALAREPVTSVVGLSLAAVGIYCSLPVFWSLPAKQLTGASAAVGIALVNSIGNLGGYIGPTAIGYMKQATGDYLGALMILAGGAFVAAVLVLSTR